MDSPFDDADFHKASGSGTGDCVEVAITARNPDTVGLRDSQHPSKDILLLTPAEWLAFTLGTAHSRSGMP
ncbi:DUF397 domain-containing protein [Nocardiopsis tropica]|uniref:DUF397 domain-containing protein n=1 Tax=Nocardiopsis tropica TaxID=109330 RepID=A0ABU7KHY4_9ACTN|nr:DUF397 domain-containing protein [Nocardiopsis umidischolae]MEE2048909.1 DUF397 domain-containing protein [Nocardiopsis umidischolae]